MGPGRSPGPGPPDQAAYVVRDLDSALPVLESLFGPFEVAEARLEDCWYRGETISAVLRLAACRAGPAEVEAVEVVPGPAPHREQLGSRGPGLHHVRFRVEDLGEAEGRAGRMGFRVVFRRRFGPAVAFCCLELPEPPGPTWVELLELPRPEPSPR